MKWVRICCLVISLTVIVCTSGAGAQPLPDYDKILQIHLKYQDSGYSVSALEVRYGKAPTLNIITGNLKGVILDTEGKELKSFSIKDPGIAQGDILGPPEGDSLIGYTEMPASGYVTITVPYLQDMQKFSLADTREGSILISADLTAPVAIFCTDYPYDPDCLARISPSKSSVPDSGLNFVLATVFSVSVIIAAGLAIITIRRITNVKMPKKQTVLIVDDEPDIIDLIYIFLNKKGYATLRASSGRECLDILKKQIPDLILLDVRMEPMDGWQTLEQIKKNSASMSIPVLMLTAKRLTAAEAKQYHLCIDDYIEKPFQSAEIYAAVDHILERKQKLKETLVLAKKAGVDKETFCEFARLTRRISVNKRIVDILQVPHQAIPTLSDLDTLDKMSVIDYITVKNRDHEKRAEQLRQMINSSFRSKGFPDFNW